MVGVSRVSDNPLNWHLRAFYRHFSHTLGYSVSSISSNFIKQPTFLPYLVGGRGIGFIFSIYNIRIYLLKPTAITFMCNSNQQSWILRLDDFKTTTARLQRSGALGCMGWALTALLFTLDA